MRSLTYILTTTTTTNFTYLLVPQYFLITLIPTKPRKSYETEFQDI